MFLKLIQCQVPQRHKTGFSHGQLAWRSLAGLGGFLGQLGGWLLGQPESAIIVGLWREALVYENFMRNHHDPIAEQGGQNMFYESIDVTLWQTTKPNNENLQQINKALRNATSILLSPAVGSIASGSKRNEAPKDQSINTLQNVMEDSADVLAQWSLVSCENPTHTLTCLLGRGAVACLAASGLAASGLGAKMCKPPDSEPGLPVGAQGPPWSIDLLPVNTLWTVLPA